MKITTKKGDRGKTSLCGGRPVSKCDLRIKAQGALDELVSLLGLAKVKAKDPAVKKKIGLIQRDLFRITGSISSGRSERKSFSVKDCDVRMLEEFGDEVEGRIRMPSGFIVPGVNESSAVLHIARAVARRAECSVVELGARIKVEPCITAYLNRLSDLLYVFAVCEERGSEPA
ncbi:MAG TPA: cob(I)yrinic acid a,c-diamide adenosyltransferase [Candidatus Omnitrophota bacterium]|nr:cob(I)yrinic acid a,c-diamide adenosyltransferase [Candidatus Omnitrophota bacterium]HOX09446.1 cob(I)yrinic acid a,c-diamide adenosyltransferase [Candidatus Omnitrophota bacterium]HPN65927.1 cob(I)yrinic acid a,c-diamide adenosyltransferase [Candidatus Omnitrophota bacterium]HRZ67315.1 cob(I)yrinic acid a,c-diamide adenosyltransferase [Candidatus Omnitrophota bacterium]